MEGTHRCSWAEGVGESYRRYHDEEWGVPSHDDRHLFEMLILEGAQAGLSWSTILNKRDGYRRAFAGFDPARVARFDRRRIERLLTDPSIVRNRAKVEAAVENARQALVVIDEVGSLDGYLWRFVGGMPIRNSWRSLDQIPAETDESRAMSRDLKRRGFRFVGPTICYAFMQAVGMVLDHVADCFRWAEISELIERTNTAPAGEAMSVDRSYVEENTRERERLAALVARLGDAELRCPVNDRWTVAAVLGHIAFWDARALVLAEKLDRGVPFTESDAEPEDVDWINDATRPLIHAIPPREAALLALRLAEETDGRVASLPSERMWPNDPDSPLNAVRAAHRGEHLDEIEAALRSR